MANEIASKTQRIIKKLYGDGNPDKAVLASLRAAETVTSMRARDVWPVMFSEMEGKDLSNDAQGTPTRAEIAIYTALRCYALAQQGVEQSVYASAWNARKDSDKKEKGVTLFQALSSMRQKETDSTALDRRVQTLLSTRNSFSVIRSITQLVQIMKSRHRDTTLDSAQLAQAPGYFGLSCEAANRIRLKWGQQYYWQTANDEKKDEGEEND